MEGRVIQGRGSWRKGGRGGNDTDTEHRSRGRGGHYRGRGKRDHHRGRGRGGGSRADFLHRNRDEEENSDEDEGTAVFSRRKLASNWDRYEEAERAEKEDDTPTQRGTDFHELLESAGDSFTQFRFSEEKDWEMDSSTASQMSVVILDLPALAQSLQQVPLHQRLDLEAELVQVSAPADLPAFSLAPKQEVPKTTSFTPPSTAFRGLSTTEKPSAKLSGSLVSSVAADEDDDEELDQLLCLQNPVSDVEGHQPVCGPGQEEGSEDVKEMESPVVEVNTEDVKDRVVTPPKSAAAKEEMTEEDLEDWLDSMIS
uniref:Apoptosis, caspase activation inhibitor n=1 Tax=Iconisemion striatum TaxID=60296 RepID=A0A1A7W728_9TELE